MSQLTGLVFDPYDDTTGEVLKSIIPDPSGLPDFVKAAHRIQPEEATAVPDDNYALVLIKEGQKLRKFATVDKGNTALSVMYLLKQAHLLPEKAVKVAAHNLLEACSRFGMEAPMQLKLAAKTGVSGVSGKSQQPYLRKALQPKYEHDFPMPEAPGETTLNPQLGKVDPADPAIKGQTNYGGVAGTNFIETPPFSVKERFSNAEGSGIDREKLAAADEATRAMFSNGVEAATRQTNFRTSPYVDVADWEPGADLVEKTAAPRQMLLNGRYPVDSYDQVKTASAYFDSNIRRFEPRDRRTYCVKLASRMSELGIQVPEKIAKYASAGYCADVDAYVGFRRQYAKEEFHPSLDMLIEKRAQVSPGTFAEALEEFDKCAGLHFYWDSEIPDPYYSTFGPSMSKIAEDEWVWDENGTRIRESDLKQLALDSFLAVQNMFGEDMAVELQKNPKTIFMSLPKPQQLILARLAADKNSGAASSITEY